MKEFMDQDFLLSNKTASLLYNKYAKDMPIYDYHCHLSAREIYEDKKYKNITEIWLGGDHYKWRAMRAHGIKEDFITGTEDDYLKFEKWAETVRYSFGNPLYHWTHMELRKYFNITDILSPKTSKEIYEKCNIILEGNELTVRKIIKKSNVNVICTTDDPIDDLLYHMKIKNDKSFDTLVLPAFRPDKAINIEKDIFISWLNDLSKVSGYEIKSLKSLKKALTERIDFFHNVGCRISDHALDVVLFEESDITEVEAIFLKALSKEELSVTELSKYKAHLMLFFGEEYSKRDWAMQLHIGAHRDNSTRMFKKLGPDTGYDSIHDESFAKNLVAILDSLDKNNNLPKTIIYTINPRDNEVVGTIIGSFQGEGIKSKVQFGSGWWFNDQLDGMNRQLESLQQLGLLAHFIGMLTDSRSYLSFTRHDYFRRLLCDRVGKHIEEGLYPLDEEFIGEMIGNICYNNAVNYFSIDL